MVQSRGCTAVPGRADGKREKPARLAGQASREEYWHKGCFHCEVCKMALNMNNYKGYEKKPYCNAHYPKQSFTTVADTPENIRLKQQSELQSQVKYKRDFEESKGRGFSIVTDTPELQRLKRTQEQISNVKYHEDFEKTKGRGFTPVVDDPVTERVRRNTQVVSDAAYKGVHPHIVEMDRRPGIIVAPVLPGAYQQSQPQGYGYMHQTSMSSMRSMHSQPHSANLRTYRAMYDYSAQDEDEVSFRDGDYIINVQPIDDGWMYGCFLLQALFLLDSWPREEKIFNIYPSTKNRTKKKEASWSRVHHD
ncbi:LIM zinc-binding domain-containing Nebulette isoform 3-T3 [Vipera latastei]